MTPECKEPLLRVLERDEEATTQKLQIMLGNEGTCQAVHTAGTASWDETEQNSLRRLWPTQQHIFSP